MMLFIKWITLKTVALYSRLKLYILLLLSLTIRCFSKVKKGRVLLWSTVGKDYSCNPLCISDYLLNNESGNYEVYWLFHETVDTSHVDKRIKKIRFGSLMHLYYINTAEFLITNHRTPADTLYWYKRSGQKYVMTWHGSMPLKKIEKDAIDSLQKSYIKDAKEDSNKCDLMLSDSKWYSDLIRRSFWYDGDILEEGMPRNDILYNKSVHPQIKEKVVSALGIKDIESKFLVMYAPTFRTNHKTGLYLTQWSFLKGVIKKRYNKSLVVLLRLHPTLLQLVNTDELITEDFVVNASVYHDMQELMIASDMLITDYSSTMFEFALLNKPCLLYTPDLTEYDRGFYFSINDLPFPVAETPNALHHQIECFDDQHYNKTVSEFLNTTFHVLGNGQAAKEFVKWMKSCNN